MFHQSYCYTLLFCLAQSLWAYTIPNATINAYPEGFDISVPDEDGICSCDIIVRCNEDVLFWTGPVLKSNESRVWTLKNTAEKLKPDDVITYWVAVGKDGKLHRACGVHIVKSFDETLATGSDTPCLKESSQYTTPQQAITVCQKGFTISIPHEDGITFSSFRGKVNSEIAVEDGEDDLTGEFLKCSENGPWVYENRDLKLQKTDSLYYSISVTKNGTISSTNGVFIIQSNSED